MKKETFLSTFFKVFVFTIMPQVLGLILGFILGLVVGSISRELYEPTIDVVLNIGLILGSILSSIYAIKVLKKDNNICFKDRFNLKKINYKYLIGGSFFILSFSFLLAEFMVKVLKLKSVTNPEFDFSFSGIILIFMVIICAPICEEIIFRFGIIEKIQTKYKPVIAIIVSTILFSLIHFYPLSATITIFVTFLGVAYIYVHTKNLIYTIVIHFLNNFFTTIVSIVNKYYPNITIPKILSISIEYIVLAVLLVVGFYLMYKEHNKLKTVS